MTNGLKKILRLLNIRLLITYLLLLPCTGICATYEEQTTAIKEIGNLFQSSHEHFLRYEYRQALVPAQTALKLSERSLGPDDPFTALSLTIIGGIYRQMGAFENALPFLKRALAINEKKQGSAYLDICSALNHLGTIYVEMHEYEQALHSFQRALTILKNNHHQEDLATAALLNDMGKLYRYMGNYNDAIRYTQQALEIANKPNIYKQGDTAKFLNELAELYIAMGVYEKALPLAQTALKLVTIADGKNRRNHNYFSYSLTLAALYVDMEEHSKALIIFNELESKIKEENAEYPAAASVMNELARLYTSMGAYDRALPLILRAEQIFEKALGSEHPYTISILGNLAVLYQSMGAFEKALAITKRVLAITEKNDGTEHFKTGIELNNLAAIYDRMGNYKLALLYMQRALAVAEKAQGYEHPSTIRKLGNLAVLYQSAGDYDSALPINQRALAMAVKVHGLEHPSTGLQLQNLAWIYFNMKRLDLARPLLKQALGIALGRLDSDAELLTLVTSNLCATQEEINLNEAIFYCKLAVNKLQKQRLTQKNMLPELKNSFTTYVKNAYFRLYRLLSASGRNNEAADILLALKETEFRDFMGDQQSSIKQQFLLPSEVTLYTALAESAEHLHKLQTTHNRIKRENGALEEIGKLDHLCDVAKKRLFKAFEDIPSALKNTNKEAGEQFKIDANLFVKHLTNINIAIPTEKNIIIIINPGEDRTQVTLYFDKNPLQLNLVTGMRKLTPLISDMRIGILARNESWHKPARLLYTALISPIEEQFKKNGLSPQNITLYLNGQLRTLPLAALLDQNEKYLIQKYRLSLYNPSFGTDGARDWQLDWNINAFGSTKGNPAENSPALPGVNKELSEIVKTATNINGILPGEMYLDTQFTRKAWKQVVSGDLTGNRRRVLHVATHFQIDSNINQSKLLMGDGTTYRVGDIAAEPGLPLAHLDLVTLSACETILNKKSDFAEFEGLGALFQSKGANAVLGTLWAVADGGTAELMREFYKARGEKRIMSKAAALQTAQLAFIRGQVKAINPIDNKEIDVRHPYYWAAFVLMGNWL
jgi:CHAT domain-containing protein/lipopolysaccharide biosynthesis regulator YciM